MNEVFSVHAKMLSETTSGLFQYGIAEFSLNKDSFSLASTAGNATAAKREIARLLSALQP